MRLVVENRGQISDLLNTYENNYGRVLRDERNVWVNFKFSLGPIFFQRELGKCWSNVKKDNGKLSEPIRSWRTKPYHYEMKYRVIISRIMTSFGIDNICPCVRGSSWHGICLTNVFLIVYFWLMSAVGVLVLLVGRQSRQHCLPIKWQPTLSASRVARPLRVKYDYITVHHYFSLSWLFFCSLWIAVFWKNGQDATISWDVWETDRRRCACPVLHH